MKKCFVHVHILNLCQFQSAHKSRHCIKKPHSSGEKQGRKNRTIRLNIELVAGGYLEYAVALTAVALIRLAQTQVVTSVKDEILVLVRSAKRNRQFYGLARTCPPLWYCCPNAIWQKR